MKPDLEKIKKVVSLNFDSRNYFFSTADETWLDWLWKNGLLDAIKQPAEDTTRISYRMPELDYLVRMAEKNPAKVVEIIMSIEISTETFNPEVVDRFLWLASKLPAEQVRTLAPKIRDDGWITLMRPFARSGYEFERIINTLKEAGDDETILIMAESVLKVRAKEEIVKKTGYLEDNPFYLSDIAHSSIFEKLASVGDSYAEKALELATHVMSDVISVSDKEPRNEVFEVGESFFLYDVDFFELGIKQDRHYSLRDDIRDLAAVIKILSERTIGSKCEEGSEALRIFEKYIATLPDTQAMWRLKMYVLSLCPEVFKDKAKQAYFRLFETPHYHEIQSGAEYEKSLRVGFKFLSEEEKRSYVAQVFDYFGKKAKEEPEKGWHTQHGWEILSAIAENLTEEEKKRCEVEFGRKCDSSYEPQPAIGKMQEGFVHDRTPVNVEEFSIEEIIKHLKEDWSPEVLKEKYKGDDFLNPRGAEGLGNALKDDVKKRVYDYVAKAPEFFDRKNIAPHYTYSFLRGIEDMLRSDTIPADLDVAKVYELFELIRLSGAEEAFKRGENEAILAQWTAVHDAVSDVLLQLLTDKYDHLLNFGPNRDQIFEILKYLFTFNDPIPAHEKPEYGDLFHIAINSVRGRAFQALTQFVYHDGKKFDKNEKIKIKDDVKALYESLLDNEKSLSVRFVIGHYLATFYFRDRKWIEGLWPKIFPTAPEDKDLYLASWEGYLASSLYEDLFIVLHDHYLRAIGLSEDEYTKRKYIREPDQGLAVHLALAFAHYADFAFESDLFKEFWASPNTKRHEEFISFIGRHCISRGSKWLEENKVNKEKLMAFWEWTLSTTSITDPEVFSGYGFWVNKDEVVLSPDWLSEKLAITIQKAKGHLDWDYGLMQQLPEFAKASPKNTLSIIENYLIVDGKVNQRQGGWIYLDRELREALDILYANRDTKNAVSTLISKLLHIGGQQFWGLKEVINKKI